MCPAKTISAKVRNQTHYALKMAVLRVGNACFRPLGVRATDEEPHVGKYYPPKPTDPPRRRNNAHTQNTPPEERDPDSNPM